MKEFQVQKGYKQQTNNKKTNRISVVNYKLPKGQIYTGQLLDDMPDGEGTLQYPNHQCYEGNFQKGKKNGQGKYFYKEGDYYTGNWLNNKKQGFGKYFYNNCQRYEGQFKNNMKHGKGIIYHENGSRYQGQFYENEKHNKGTYYDVPAQKLINFVFDKGIQIQCQQQEPEIKLSQQKQIESFNINQNKLLNFESPDKTALKIVSNIIELNNKTNKSIQASSVSNYTSFYEDENSHQNIIKTKTQQKIRTQKENCLQIKNQYLRNKRIDLWTSQDVSQWLDEISFADYTKEFLSQRITGFSLLQLDQEDLKELIVTDQDRNVFSKQIQFLKMMFKVQCLDDQISKKKQQELDLQLIKKLTVDQQQGKKSKHFMTQGQEQKQYKSVRSIQENQSCVFQNNQPSNAQVTNSSSNESSEQGDKTQEQNTKPNKKRKINIQKNIEQYMEKKRIDINDIIPKQQIKFIRQIGRGGYGQVHLATWMGQYVAVKRYIKKRGFRNRHIAHFLEQAQITYKLLHPNIVLYMGMFVDDNQYAIVMEYLSGGNLFNYLHSERAHKPKLSKVYKICKDIALAMTYLHGKNIIHCDLKSSNLLFDENGKIKVSDFGLSQIISPTSDKKSRRRHRLGTPSWMAPQVIGGQSYDFSSDVYSFGVVIWQLMKSQIPQRQNQANQVKGQYKFVQLETPSYEDEFLVNLFLQCTQKAPQKRPTFKQILKMLEQSQKNILTKKIKDK